ncbi:hypothetical protein F-S17_0196 [Faustovirus]|nr:hypothetical protein F-M6_0212 [Faustovirus]QJX72462.1 hypothetical protein F-S17_0196 [Faustovirus]
MADTDNSIEQSIMEIADVSRALKAAYRRLMDGIQNNSALMEGPTKNKATALLILYLQHSELVGAAEIESCYDQVTSKSATVDVNNQQ